MADGRADGFVRSREIDIHRDFIGKENGEVCDHAAFTGGKNDADPFLFSGEFDLFGKGDGCAEELFKRQFRVIGSVKKSVVRGVELETLEEGDCE